MPDFIMPTPAEIAGMDCTEIENKRVECLKAIQEIKNNRLTIRLALNDLKRQIAERESKKLDLGEAISRSNVAEDALDIAADELKSIFFRKRS
jgi:hypothetical protein